MEKGISLNDIWYFVEVAKRGSFSATAAALDMPVATLSRRISELEKNLGYALFLRTTRKVSLTDLGTRYFEECVSQIEGILNAHENVKTYLESPEGKLRVSIMPGLAPLLPGVSEELHRRFPKISCDFDLSSSTRINDLAGMDLYIRAGRQEDSPLIQKPLVNFRLILVASHDYLRQRGRPESPAELHHHAHICMHGADTWELRRGTEVETVQLTPKFSSNQILLNLQLAGRDLGITPVPYPFSGSQLLQNYRLERVLPDWELSSAMLYALFESRVISAKATAFLDILVKHLQAHFSLGKESVPPSAVWSEWANGGNTGG